MSDEGGRLKRVDRVLGPVVWFAAGALVLMLFVGPILIAEDEPQQAAAEPRYESAPDDAAGAGAGADGEDVATGAAAAAADGEALFAENCGSCHTLAAAGTSGTVGPSLDDAGLDAAAIAGIVSDGQGGMPSFEGQLDEAEIGAVASFVAESSGGG